MDNRCCHWLGEPSKGEELIKRLWYVFYAHIILAVLKIVLFYYTASIGDIVAIIILYIGITHKHHWVDLVYMILVAISAILTIVAIIGGGVFHSGYAVWYIIFVIILLAFYLTATWLSYLGFREFKQLHEEKAGS